MEPLLETQESKVIDPAWKRFGPATLAIAALSFTMVIVLLGVNVYWTSEEAFIPILDADPIITTLPFHPFTNTSTESHSFELALRWVSCTEGFIEIEQRNCTEAGNIALSQNPVIQQELYDYGPDAFYLLLTRAERSAWVKTRRKSNCSQQLPFTVLDSSVSSPVTMTLYHQYQNYNDITDVNVKGTMLINSVIVKDMAVEFPKSCPPPVSGALSAGSWVRNNGTRRREYIWKMNDREIDTAVMMFDRQDKTLHPCLVEGPGRPTVNITIVGDSHMRVSTSELLARLNGVIDRDYKESMSIYGAYTDWKASPPLDTKVIKVGRLWIRLIGDARLVDDFAWTENNTVTMTSDIIVFSYGQWVIRDLNHGYDAISGHWPTQQYLNRLRNYAESLATYRTARSETGRELRVFFQTMPAYKQDNGTRVKFAEVQDMRTHRRMQYRVDKSIEMMSEFNITVFDYFKYTLAWIDKSPDNLHYPLTDATAALIDEWLHSTFSTPYKKTTRTTAWMAPDTSGTNTARDKSKSPQKPQHQIRNVPSAERNSYLPTQGPSSSALGDSFNTTIGTGSVSESSRTSPSNQSSQTASTTVSQRTPGIVSLGRQSTERGVRNRQDTPRPDSPSGSPLSASKRISNHGQVRNSYLPDEGKSTSALGDAFNTTVADTVESNITTESSHREIVSRESSPAPVFVSTLRPQPLGIPPTSKAKSTSRAVSPRRSRMATFGLEDAEFGSPDSATTITPGLAAFTRPLPQQQQRGNGHSLHADMEVSKFSEGLDKWTGLMKRAILADFVEIKGDLSSRLIDQHAQESQILNDGLAEYGRQIADLSKNLNEAEKISSARLKLVEAAATFLINKRSKAVMFLAFARWRLRYAEVRKTIMCDTMAIKHHRRALQRKVFESWQHEIGASWRKREAKKIKMESERTLETLALSYEKRISELTNKLNDTLVALKESEVKRAAQQADMKQAFMRGVCALNMEALTVFGDATVDQAVNHDDAASNSQPVESNRHVSINTTTTAAATTTPLNRSVSENSAAYAHNPQPISQQSLNSTPSVSAQTPFQSSTSSSHRAQTYSAPVNSSNSASLQPRGVYVTRHIVPTPSSPDIPRRNNVPVPQRYPSRG
ncbi:hypothetical protein SmJEL517_g04467 [Synchytrium microbalum]|uniref:Centrosomal protein POC5 n=1 Tax=Synchytrium microbalum TaxID=1806994 RepID=A0A507BZ83_9FUNG|nr:uncharacterized protein SmJEL517_g04467 [Synchytrium microbalum]TPX32418.1 hypothetical protein SmJEL517_g04467 [Synchytrium microbalum]